MSNRPGPATLALTFSDAALTVDEPLPRKVGTARLMFLPPWD